MIINNRGSQSFEATRTARGRSRHRVRPLAEILEARQLLAVITITSAGDADGADGGTTLSLRQAIEIANGTLAVGSLSSSQAGLVVGDLSTPNTIDFDIPGTGPFNLAPTTALPTINSPVIINGYSQPGAQANTNPINQADNAALEIELVSGSQTNTTGLDINAGNSLVEGLAVGGFALGGIVIGFGETGGSVISGDFIGTDTTGLHELTLDYEGQAIVNGEGLEVSGNANTVGGTSPAARNIISGNKNGFYLLGSDNLVEGNFVGTDATGAVALANQAYGVGVVSLIGSGNTIGGTSTQARNVISGNVGEGIDIESGGTLTEGNFIGTDLTGTQPISNGIGIEVDYLAGTTNTIGGTSAGQGNLISACNVAGISVKEGSCLIQGNLIGTDVTGTLSIFAISNQYEGIDTFSDSNTIGGTVAGARNIISGDGVGINLDSSDNLVEGNYVGTDITGTLAVPNVNGIQTAKDANTIGGTVAGARNIISGNSNTGLQLNSGNSVVEGNYIGTDLTGTVAVPNEEGMGDGDGGSDTIGGTSAGAGNLISGNSYVGLAVGAYASLVEGNYIGTDVTGAKALSALGGKNVTYGIQLGLAYSSTIGGTAAGAGNVISGNDYGIELVSMSASDVVEGNLIGTDLTGTVAVPNQVGIGILGFDGSNTIGGTVAAARNVISGNTTGIDLTSPGNLVEGNFIGTDVTGTVALPNNTGIEIEGGSTSNTIGGTGAGARNVISGNTSTGITITSAGETVSVDGDNLVEGNFIGTDITGTKAISEIGGVSTYGIEVEASDSNTIGGTVAGARNVISGNDQGVEFLSGSSANLVEGNFVGTDLTGTVAVPNESGIDTDTSGSNTIGGLTAGARNVISGNKTEGISAFEGNILVEGNFIGTDVTGTKAVPNNYGVGDVSFSGSETIGGTAAGAGNVISGNSTYGIEAAAQSNLIEGNLIGTDLTGTKAVPNGYGINAELSVFGAKSSATVGGTVAAARNVISGNFLSGILMFDGSSDNLVEGNFIGTDITGSKALPDSLYGILIQTSASNTIGGTAAGAGNVIAFNGDAGVGVGTVSSSDNPFVNDVAETILGNSIYSNGGLGIDLGLDGVTADNPAGSAIGPNLLQPYPVLTSASASATDTTISGTLDAAASKSYTIEFFANLVADHSGNGQGQTYIGSKVVKTDATGHAAFTFDAPVAVTHQYLSATATDSQGNTSEFAKDVFTIYSTTTNLTVPLEPVLVGQAFTLVATVGSAPGTGTPTGNVDFIEDGRPIGSATLNASGSASLMVSGQNGLHVFSAEYVGTTTEAASSSSPFDLTPVQQATTAVLQTSSTSTTTGLPLTLTALVTFDQGVTPTGTIDFTEDGQPIGSAALNGSGSGSLTIPAPQGSHTFEVQYAGTVFEAVSSSNPVVVTAVNQATTTTLLPPASPTTVGQSVTFTAVVTASVTGVPTGLVYFGTQGVLIGDAPVNSSGVATFSTSGLSLGNDVIVAYYVGDATNAPSLSNVVTEDINQETSVTLLPPASPATVGQSVTFTAVVTASVTGVPTGLVYFGTNGVLLGYAPVNSSGVATFSTSGLSLGNDMIVAYYVGDAGNAPSLSNSIMQSIVYAGPTVTSVEELTSTSVEVSFSRPLLAVSAKNRANYTIVGSNRHALTIKSAAYNAADDAVILTTRQAFSPLLSYQLTVNGVRKGRVTGTNQIPLAGKNGKSGTSFIGRITPKATRAVVQALADNTHR